jgi:hypothetical protein
MSSRPYGADDVVTVEKVQDQLNLIENALNALSGEDEYLRAILQNQQIQLLQELNRQGLPDGPTSTEGVFSNIDKGALPIDAIGVAAEDIPVNDTGDAVFQLQGSTFRARVRNKENFNLDAGAAIEVVGEGNSVQAAGAGAGVGGLFSADDPNTFQYRGRLRVVPRVTDAGDMVRVTNQKYEGETYTDVEPSLNPGEVKTVAEITARRNEFILFKHTNATAHSTVDYNYYVDDDSEPDPSLSGNQPWATPPDLYEVTPDGYQLVADSVKLEMVETSGNTSYDSIAGTLTGFVLQV